MNVTLLAYLKDAERVIAASSMATRRGPAESILDALDEEDARKHVAKVLARGHESISEFAFFVFSVSGVSRVLTHQLVRHRIASYLQMSSRHVDLSKAGFVIPPKVKDNAEATKLFLETVRNCGKVYKELLKLGMKYEDARYVLPDSVETHITIGINARSLNNLLGLRLCEKAQWEIRELASRMRELVKPIAPSLFWSDPRPCVRRGFCPEGEKTCGFSETPAFGLEREKFKKGYPDE